MRNHYHLLQIPSHWGFRRRFYHRCNISEGLFGLLTMTSSSPCIHRKCHSQSYLVRLIIVNDAINLRTIALENIPPHDGSNGHKDDETSRVANIYYWLSSKLLEMGKLKSLFKMCLEINHLVCNPAVLVEAV